VDGGTALTDTRQDLPGLTEGLEGIAIAGPKNLNDAVPERPDREACCQRVAPRDCLGIAVQVVPPALCDAVRKCSEFVGDCVDERLHLCLSVDLAAARTQHAGKLGREAGRLGLTLVA
jgi:hypothetical protein